MTTGIDYAGHYRTDDGVAFNVMLMSGGLLLELSGQTPLPLRATSESDFFAEAVNLHVHFEMSDGGIVNAMTVFQHGKTIRTIRDGRAQ